MKRTLAAALVAVMAAFVLTPVVLAADPVDFKDPRNLEGNTWAVKDMKATIPYVGPVNSDMEITVREVKAGKKAGESVVVGKFHNLDKISKYEENTDIDTKVKVGKDGFPKFTFANRAGDWLTAQVLPTGDLVLSGRLPDVVLTRVSSGNNVDR